MTSNFRYTIQIDEEKEIELIAIHQTHTYESLLNGPPNKRIDSQITQEFERLASRLYPRINHVKIFLQSEENQDSYVRMPPVACIARFRANWLSTDEGYYVIVYSWYQEEFAFPIDENVEKYIGTLDIEKYGTLWSL